jgi:hypothetical protein
MSNLIKIRPVGAELFHADGRTDRQTDMKKLIVVFAILQTRQKMLTVKHSVYGCILF